MCIISLLDLRTEVGYTQGTLHNPSYEDVCSGSTGHNECVRVQYDPKEIEYVQLVELLWSRIDPTTLNRQVSNGFYGFRVISFSFADFS